VGKVDERFKASYGVWIVREPDNFYALSTVCTHLGCTPNWLSSEGKFKCPCHGSGFVITGINVEGPAPRPLERYKIGLSPDGQIEIDKNTKYQEEKGQWTMDGSFLSYTA
jgi:cytochrome b6-f complex iron-sulfur subunit